jgi:myo-inositol-1(or 4)-monophosphatase
VDPLDGTNNFAVGLPQFCVSIGVVSNGNLTFGVVYNPILEELFIAQSGMGAFLNGTRLHVSQQPLHSTLVATAFPFKVREKVGWYNQLFNAVYPYVMDIRRMGSAALDTMYTAGGIFGLYFEYGINPWDVSAGVLAVQEAGGVVLDFSGQPYDLFKSRSIIAGSRENVELVINAWGDLGGRAESH